MNVGGVSDEQYERLKIAEQTRKYGHLASWKEIFLFQLHFANEIQRQEIIDWSTRQIIHRDVYLPLMNMVKKGGEINNA